jgi:long-chain fatty acid transport protein
MTSPLLAGGIDNKTNYSVDYIRSLNRNAATDSADAVVYNPAGVMKMENGMYLQLDLQYTAIKEATNRIVALDAEFESDKTDIVPALFALYKKDQWAAFAGFSIPAGGGSVEFKRGNASTFGMAALSGGLLSMNTGQYLEGKSVYYGYTVGGAYAFNDIFSVSLAARYINAEKEANVFLTTAGPSPTPFHLDYQQDDSGLGFILGANITPVEALNIGVRYESKTGLDLETTVNRNDFEPFYPLLPPEALDHLPSTGDIENRDLPALVGLGVAYNITPKFKVEADLTYYLNKNADWSDEKYVGVDNGFDLGVALEYSFSPELKGSVGYLLTQTGLDPDGLLPEWPELDAHSIAAGLAYEFNTAWTLNAGLSKTFYGDETTSSMVTLEKDLILLGVGVQYKY